MQNRPLSRLTLPTESVKNLQAYIKSFQHKPSKNKEPSTSNFEPETSAASSASAFPYTRKNTRRATAEMEHDVSP
ncbi:unnamed protein product [Hymenolepis diminuta]|uniref:Uncharacterized protein n=1 Tax=Hymenolepis diminuta TaxID=6216 RepID=A0A564YA08_HYMDI|nr:unnamed protein product [Hymenolepis diminuta]